MKSRPFFWETKRLGLFLAIFAHVDRDRDGDDDALDDLLPHRGDVDKLQAVLDDREDQNTGDDAADLTDTAVQRDAADDAGGDCVELIAVAVVVGGARGTAASRTPPTP